MAATAAIILAAGKSTRMQSGTPKVLHEICGRPMLAYVLAACTAAGVDRLIVVVGHGKDAVIQAFGDHPGVSWVEQTEQKGTGHAVLVCESELGAFAGRTMVMAGDMPLVRSDTVAGLLAENAASGDGVTLASSIFDDPTGYGRVLRDADGRLSRIVEEVDCTESQRTINEVNISYYCFDNQRLFEALHEVKPDNAKGEYYITDAVHVLIDRGHGAGATATVKPQDAMGVNSRADLALVNSAMQRRIQEEWMERGVTIVDRGSTWIEAGCSIGCDTVIHPFSHLRRGARIGEGSRIGPFALVTEETEVSTGGTAGPVQTTGARCS